MRKVMLFSSMLIILSLIFVFTGCQKQEAGQELPSSNYLSPQDNEPFENSDFQDFGNPSDIEDSPETNISTHELDIYQIHHYHII